MTLRDFEVETENMPRKGNKSESPQLFPVYASFQIALGGQERNPTASKVCDSPSRRSLLHACIVDEHVGKM
jgi:hypothetical protein